MKKILFIVTACALLGGSALAQEPNTLTKKEKKDGWKLLFDGKSTAGWHTYRRDTVGSKWQVQDGMLVFDQSKPRAGGGDIVTNDIYENYDLRLEWKVAKGSNSGIIFDVQEDPKYGATYQTGPEMQVLDNIDAADNKLQNHLAGCLYDMIGDATVSKPKPVGEWNQVRLLQKNGRITFWLNDIKTVDIQMGSPEWNEILAKSKFGKPDASGQPPKAFADFAKVHKGKIALQEHPGSSYWRNIKIKAL